MIIEKLAIEPKLTSCYTAYFLMEETKNKTLEEINLMFSPIAAASIRAAQVELSFSREKDAGEQVVEQE